jgi:hypothetical protein
LEEVDLELMRELRSTFSHTFIRETDLPETVASEVEAGLEISISPHYARLRFAGLGEAVSSWDGSEGELRRWVCELAVAAAENVHEDKVEDGRSRWDHRDP